MKKLRTLAASATLSLALLGGAAGTASAQGAVQPNPTFAECVTHMASDGGVGPHVRKMHQDATTVGQHLYMMLASGHECDVDMHQ